MAPLLPERCRRFHRGSGDGKGLSPFDAQLWQGLGIEESIALPGQRLG